jgi:plastocyanin
MRILLLLCAFSGQVKYQGKPPAPALLDRSSEAACAKNKAYAEDVVVDKKGGLSGVLVRVKTGTAGKHSAPKKSVVIRQSDCTYTPRVAGIMNGQELVIENQDGFLHNVNAKIDGETQWNKSQPKGASALKQKDFGAAGQVLELGCDVHPWMRAYVPITDHPFFTVTGKDGTFKLDGVPNKELTLEAWHPTLGLKTQAVKPGAKVEFVFP